MNELKQKLKLMIIEALELEDIEAADINDDDALFGDGLGLDSIDALEIGLALKKEFGIEFNPKEQENNHHFQSINSLAKFVESQIKTAD